MVDEAIEAAGEEAADGRLAFASDAAGADLVVVAGLNELEHFGEESGWILKIGVHGDNDVAAGVVEASEQ